MSSSLFDSSILATAQQAVEFVSSILESSTEYSVIGKDLDGKILLWNEGARRMYGYEAEEVVGKLNSEVLHTPEDVAVGKPREIMEAALRDGKWEGVIGRVRKDGRRISARVVITPLVRTNRFAQNRRGTNLVSLKKIATQTDRHSASRIPCAGQIRRSGSFFSASFDTKDARRGT